MLPVLRCSWHMEGAALGNWTLWSTLVSDGPTPQTPCRHLKTVAVKISTVLTSENQLKENHLLKTMKLCGHLPTWGVALLFIQKREQVRGLQTLQCCLGVSHYSYSNPCGIQRILLSQSVVIGGRTQFQLVHPSPVVYFVTCILLSS